MGKPNHKYVFNLKTFEELGVSEEIRRAIAELGFESPMPVQEEVIPYLLGNKNDVVALAQTGTGKTEDDMMKVRNLGRKSLEEVKKKLEDLGLSLMESNE